MTQWLQIALPISSTAAVLAGGASYATFIPRSAVWGRLVWRGSRAAPTRVALTFDDGPLPGATDRILETLNELNVKAAFFMIGRSARAHPHLVRQVHQQGHIVANHTFDHRGLGFLHGKRFWQEQIDRTSDAIEQAIGFKPRLFRPPLGIKTWYSAHAAASRGQTVVTWTHRAMDGITTTPQRILQRLLPRSHPGDILTLHDGVSPQSRRDPSATVEALRPLITELRARGLEPVRLDELTGVRCYAN